MIYIQMKILEKMINKAIELSIGGFVIMWLWNALIPMIFGLITLTYWQSVGLLILSSELFKQGTIKIDKD